MMVVFAGIVLAILIVAAVVSGRSLTSQFRAYCDEVAKATGRTEENGNNAWLDDAGNNAFRREQWWNLVIGNFYGIPDLSIVARGRVLSQKIRVSYLWAAAGLALLFYIAK